MSLTKIATLGQGITATAVQQKISKLIGYALCDIQDADFLVPCPGIPFEQIPTTNAQIISEIELAFRLFHRKDSGFCPQLIATTGTNGKSTVTSMIAHVLGSPACGNIGVPLIEFVDSEALYPFLSVELSSYQLEFCTTFRPKVSIILNITPDHLARHKTMENYAAQKAKIFQNQGPDNALIYNAQDPILENILKKPSPFKKIPFDDTHDLNRFSQLQLPGKHNQLNALAAFYALREIGMDDPYIVSKLNTFQGLEHRLERVLTVQGRTFYNDSKATNPESTEIAVRSFTQPIHLIICGKDKQLKLEPFIQTITQTIKSITVYGEITDRFMSCLSKIAPHFPVSRVSDTEEAIMHTFDSSQPGDIILFSPACSSFDQFDNFEHRGKVFKELVFKKYGT